MAKKGKPELTLEKVMKKYFSSLTARRGAFLFTGLTEKPQHMILSNLEPDKIIKFCDATFGMHILDIQNDIEWKMIKKVFSFLGVGNSDRYVIKITAVISFLSKVKFDLEKAEIKRDDNDIVYFETPGKNGEIIKNPLAWPLLIFQTEYLLYNLYHNFIDINESNPQYISRDVDPTRLKQGMLVDEFSSEEYVDKDGEAAFSKDSALSFRLSLIDGLDVVSNKEFLAKHKDKYRCKIITWAHEGCVEYITIFEDDDMRVISMRPHVRFYVKPQLMKKKKKGK